MKKAEINIKSKDYWNFRKEKIGSSDAPVIMLESPWKTPYQLWKEKLSSEDQEITFWMARGNDLEPEARALASKMLGMDFEEGVVLLHPEYPNMMMASLDGFHEASKTILEIKCPGKKDHEIAVRGEIPNKYFAQLQHQLACLPEANHSYYFSYDGENGVCVKVEKNKDYINYMISKEKEFFRHMQDMTQPNYEFMDIFKRNDEEWNNLANEYLAILREVNTLKNELDEKKSRLINLAADKPTIGAGILVEKVVRKGNINYDAIPELKEINLERYRKEESSFWRIKECGG